MRGDSQATTLWRGSCARAGITPVQPRHPLFSPNPQAIGSRLSTVVVLIEIPNASQVPGEPQRRWFTSDDLDLVVWCDESGRPSAFQLCYDKGRSERALTWKPDRGFSHVAVDDGERVRGKHKATPILLGEAPLSATLITERFAHASTGLPAAFVEFVSARLAELPDHAPRA